MSKKGCVKGCVSHCDCPKLTAAELDVLHLLTDEFLSVKQVSIRRKCSPQAVRKIRQRLRNKGVLGMVANRVAKREGSSEVALAKGNKIRLHAEHFSVNIIWCDDRYRKRVKDGVTQFMLDGNTVICYRNKIEVYSNKDFWGVDPNAAKVKSLSYWTGLFLRLEGEVNCSLVKDRSQNITLVRAEYAEVGNELARKALVEHEKVRVVGDDGKVWLLIDNSFKFEELEAVHRSRSKDDMQNVVQPFFNDLRSGGENILLPQQVSNNVLDLQKNLMQLQTQIQSLTDAQLITVKQFNNLLELKKNELSNGAKPSGYEGTELKGDLLDYFG